MKRKSRWRTSFQTKWIKSHADKKELSLRTIKGGPNRRTNSWTSTLQDWPGASRWSSLRVSPKISLLKVSTIQAQYRLSKTLMSNNQTSKMVQTAQFTRKVKTTPVLSSTTSRKLLTNKLTRLPRRCKLVKLTILIRTTLQGFILLRSFKQEISLLIFRRSPKIWLSQPLLTQELKALFPTLG